MAHRAATGSFALSDNSYDTVNLTAKDIGCLVKVNINLFDDAAINVADDINSSIAEAQLIREDSDYILGDGSATYGNQLGLANALPAGAYINASGGTWASITSGDITKIIGSVENVNPSRLAFLGSRQWFAQVGIRLNVELQRFKDIIGPSTGGGDASLLGYPFYFTQVMPTASAGTSKCLYFGDFVGGSMLGVRKEVQVATSDSFYFDTGDIAIRAHARMNVNIHGDGRGSTFGPIVSLVTT
jgi:HK97 family phage major capsid protein